MKRSNRLVLLVGILLAAIAFVGVILLSGGGGTTGGTQAPPDPDVTAVFAIQEIALGAPITADAVENRTIKSSQRAANAIADESLVVGKTARARIFPEQQITQTELTGGVAGAPSRIDVPPGLVGVSIQVDQVSGVGTIIRPGDYVDLVVGITGNNFPVILFDDQGALVGSEGLEINKTSVKILAQGMQVLGTLLPPPPAQAQAQQTQASPAASGEPGTGLTGQQAIVIVAASPQQAEIIKFAQLDGSISLVLRSAQDFIGEDGQPTAPPPVGTTGIILRELVDTYGVLVPELVETVLPEGVTAP